MRTEKKSSFEIIDLTFCWRRARESERERERVIRVSILSPLLRLSNNPHSRLFLSPLYSSFFLLEKPEKNVDILSPFMISQKIYVI
jgi:hypothetical protein